MSQSFTNKNGKKTSDGPWKSLGIKKQEPFKLNLSDVKVSKEMSRTVDNFNKGFRSSGRPIKSQKRFDQFDQPVYPMFETTQKYKVVRNNGWGIDRKSLKYRTAHPQKGLSMKRSHLEYFD